MYKPRSGLNFVLTLGIFVCAAFLLWFASRGEAWQITLAAVLTLAGPAAAFDFNISAGLDFGGSVKGGNFDYDSATGYSLGIEVAFDLPIVEVGAGLEYGFPRGTDATDVGDVDLDYTFLYGVGRITIFGPLYLMARAGYSDVSASDVLAGEVSGGVSWSVGAGVGFLDKLKVEAFVNNFSADVDTVDVSFDYTTYSLRVLYTF